MSEMCGRCGGVWEGLGSVVGGVCCVVRGVEVCESGRRLWWKG